MSAATPQDRFATPLIAWQATHGRHDLPWQRTTDPYRVWLSEIMLQQTQVSTVLAYYERFLQRFPDVQALAAASQDDVLALWSGLGYYSRARNLHACAKAVVAEHGGEFPKTAEVLQALPGIGRSTAAAIASFCFGERVAILDGNVKRVLTRFLAFDKDLAVPRHERELWAAATELLPPTDMPAYTQGIMDLGATVCLARSPQCLLCPVQAGCEARRSGTQDKYPIKTRKLKRSKRENAWLWLSKGDELWLCQRPETGVWAGLWSLPEFASPEELTALAETWPGTSTVLPSFTHVLTHLDWTLHPLHVALSPQVTKTALAAITALLPAGGWYRLDEALAMGLPAPLRKLLLSRAT
ncbi:A/G-specific adenine glycosylase [Piscinibacter gummiphilus]|uniref:Adenine DNA glycosylase n=1 Tax=Piscinibacter gummiphilus TaxID=946333 RepID=A0ABZ0CW68_9BURK|nr:A/G-specific adenine glycosylase [Piscinibacter gummiphilus]WOB09212.1 A/G-specific adenine glycosylase [Piscinibacter gummiphilus]